MRHFVHYPNGGPHPGTCALCGSPRDFFDTGAQHFSGGNVMLCRSCIADLAYNIGFTLAEPLEATIVEKDAEIEDLKRQLSAIPTELEGFIDGIRNSLADFVLAISSSDNTNVNSPVPSDDGSIKRNQQSKQDSKRQPKARTEPFVNERSISVSTNTGSDNDFSK